MLADVARAPVVAKPLPGPDDVARRRVREGGRRRIPIHECPPSLDHTPDLRLLGHHLAHEDRPRIGVPRSAEGERAPVAVEPDKEGGAERGDVSGKRASSGGSAWHAGRIPAAARDPGSALRGDRGVPCPAHARPPRDPGRRPVGRDYFDGMTRTEPMRIFVGSTVGFAALSAAMVTPNFWEIAHMVSLALTV